MNVLGFATILGIAVAVFVAYAISKKRGCYEDLLFDMVLCCVPIALITSRLFFCIAGAASGQSGNGSFFAYLFDLFERGGFSLYGVIAGCLVGIAILVLINRTLMNKNVAKYSYRDVSFLQIADVAAMILPMLSVTYSLGMFIDGGADLQTGTAHLVVSVMNVLLYALILWLYVGKRKSFDGAVSAVYLAFTGLISILTGAIAVDEWKIFGGAMAVSQIMGAVAFLIGAAAFILHIMRAVKSNKTPFVFVGESKLCDEYYGYDKSLVGKPSLEERRPQKTKEIEFEEVSDDDAYWMENQSDEKEDNNDKDR